MDSSCFDRVIEFMISTTGTDDANCPVTRWTVAFTASADVAFSLGREVDTKDSILDSQSATFTIRYRRGITGDMQIRYEGQHYRIGAPIEIGRRKYLEISGRAVAKQDQ